MHRRIRRGISIATLLPISGLAIAGGQQGPVTPDTTTIIVTGSRTEADAASTGTATAEQLENRPRLRTGEILEVVPGLIVTQHSGTGKANQYFLRGFNLDHGTDFATSVVGMPVNMPTHGHGQGYTDLNFVIPELISTIRYEKGPYDARAGDFSAAGSAQINYVNALPQGLADITVGDDEFRRYLVADSTMLAGGDLLGAFEYGHSNGPWDVPEDGRKINAVLRYSRGDSARHFSVTGMAYDADWTSTDQIPRRAVDNGLIGRFGSLDPSDGGKSSRYSLSFEGQRRLNDNSALQANLYAIDYDFNLYSNFTYFLDDPVNGDQFEQVDHRQIYGGALSYDRNDVWFGLSVEQGIGLQLRADHITQVGLFHTVERKRLSTTRDDAVDQIGLGLYYRNAIRWNAWLRSVAGLRADGVHYDVDSNTAANSGSAHDQRVSPKLSLVFGPWAQTEIFLNGGYGFHSNDGRGATISVDPASGDRAQRVDPLVQAKGAEIGTTTHWLPSLSTSATVWVLDLDSELLFVGDAGSTEPSRPSRRDGVEISTYWQPHHGVIIDADFAFSRARFSDDDPAGDRIPGAIERTASVGAVVNDFHQFFGGLRLRYFGGRPLIEDNSERSASSTLFNLRGGYAFTPNLRLAIDVFNLFDRKVSDIDYYYTSQLSSESTPVDDVHFHPAEPRSVRATLSLHF